METKPKPTIADFLISCLMIAIIFMGIVLYCINPDFRQEADYLMTNMFDHCVKRAADGTCEIAGGF